MPPVIAAAAASVAGAAGVALGATTAAAIGQIGFGLIVTGASLAASSLLGEDAEAARFDSDAGGRVSLGQDDGRKLTVRQAVPLRRFLYGALKVSGPLFLLELANPWVYMGIVLGDGPIDGVTQIEIGGRTVNFDSSGAATTFPYRDGPDVFLYLSVRDGSAGQAIDPILAADFPQLPATFRQQGVATAVLKIGYGRDRDHHETLWPQGAIDPLFVVKGVKVYDPRASGQDAGDKSTWAWSDNASLCQAHYLTNKWRRPLLFGEIGMDALVAAANVDDEAVGLAAGGTEKRYSCNGIVGADQSDFDIVDRMATANNGFLSWQGARYVMRSAAPRAPVLTLVDGDFTGPIGVRNDIPVRNTLNRVRTVFVAPNREYQNANGPIVENADYLAADGRPNEKTLDQRFNDSPARAQRLAKQVMEQARLGRQVSATVGDIADLIEAGDIVEIDSFRVPPASGTFRAREWHWGGGGAELVLRQYSDAVYDWDAATDEQPFTISPPDLEA